MNIRGRLDNLDKEADLLEGMNNNRTWILFQDNQGLYHRQWVDGKRVKIYPTQEELDNYRDSRKGDIIIFHSSLEQEVEFFED